MTALDRLDPPVRALLDQAVDYVVRIRDEDPAELWAALDRLDRDRLTQLVCMLAALVPVDRTMSELIAWTASIDTAMVRDLNAQGLCDAKIAGHLGVHTNTIYHLRAQAGIPRIAPHRRRQQRRVADEELVAEVRRLNAEGLWDAQVAARLGVSRKTVQRLRARHGIPPSYAGRRRKPAA